MKFQFVFGFILLIIFFVAMFVGLPYLLEKIKFRPLFSFSIPKITMPSVPMPNYFYNWTQTSTLQPFIRIEGASSFGREQINLRASYFTGELNISGWRIKSVKRGEILIGKGINLLQYDSAISDVRIVSGETIEIIAGTSPVVNNFRINSCFGGLSSVYNLGYSFSCPAIKPVDFSYFDSSCQDLILRSDSCRAPSDNILNKQSSNCRIWFEKNVNYNTCVANHQNDRDFYKGWKIYTGNNNQIFDPLHDKIELRDQAGLLIDSYEY